MPFTTDKFHSLAINHQKRPPLIIFDYGTSGIRSLGIRLDSTAFRMGILAAIRSQHLRNKVIGVMVTASHNPSEDNGLKIIDANGSMLDSRWEPECTLLANATNEDLEYIVRDLMRKYQATGTCSVFVARDTRGTSPGLSRAVIDGARVLDAEVRDFGILTTPQLHYIVHSFNRGVGDPTEEGYYNKLSKAYKDLCHSFVGVPMAYIPLLNIDCACGVGAVAIKKLAPLLLPFLHLRIHNDETGVVNFECGSYVVESSARQPANCAVTKGEGWASFDGDADRVIFYYRNADGRLKVLNGDKIAALVCSYIKDLLQELNLEDKLTLQVIQTAYSNGRSPEYLEDILHVHVEVTPTGVKHLLRKTDQCDISIWFESNGHGSVKFNEKAYEMVKEKIKTDQTGAAKSLIAVFDLMNQATGDAICDALLVEGILRARDWEFSDWDGLYIPYPSRLTALTVPNRNFIKTNDIATEVIEPAALKAEIDSLIGEFGESSRVIVRPSGTEDNVRIYVESSTQTYADQLADKVAQAIRQFAFSQI